MFINCLFLAYNGLRFSCSMYSMCIYFASSAQYSERHVIPSANTSENIVNHPCISSTSPRATRRAQSAVAMLWVSRRALGNTHSAFCSEGPRAPHSMTRGRRRASEPPAAPLQWSQSCRCGPGSPDRLTADVGETVEQNANCGSIKRHVPMPP